MAEAVFGWDIGGAHLKACRLERGAVADVALWGVTQSAHLKPRIPVQQLA